MKLKKLISQPYPCQELERSVLEHAWRSALIGLFIAIFLMIFEPFGISKWNAPEKPLFLAGFGLVTFGCVFIMRVLISTVLIRHFKEENWTVGREIILNMTYLLLIATGNYLYTAALGANSLSFYSFLWSFMTVFCIGIFPISFGVLANYHRALKKYQRAIDIKPHFNQNKKVTLLADNEKDELSFDSDDLLYIESADNYSKVVLTTAEPQLLRSSLSRLENQIESEKIKRCHRSFVVNLGKVQKVTGNAQGYKLHLEATDILIPVARKYSSLVNDLRGISQ